jgi:hypothetical protein
MDLKDILDKDRFNQAMSNSNKGTGFGGSIGGTLVGPPTGGAGSTGGASVRLLSRITIANEAASDGGLSVAS